MLEKFFIVLLEIIESINISKEKCNNENLRTLNKILKIEG